MFSEYVLFVFDLLAWKDSNLSTLDMGQMRDKNIVHSQVKGLSSEEFAARNDLVLALPERIQAIPDGTPAAPKKTGGWASSVSRTEIKFDSGNWCYVQLQ